jgi:hypothetical protein
MDKKASLIGLLALILVFLVAFSVSRTKTSEIKTEWGSVSGTSTSAAEDAAPTAANIEIASSDAATILKIRPKIVERTDSVYQHPKRTAILDPETKAIIINCSRRIESGLTVHKLADFQTLTEYLDKTTSGGHLRISRVLQYRIIRLLSGNGQKIRLSIAPHANQNASDESINASVESTDPAAYEIHLISQDDDGLYGSIPLPDDLRGLSVEQTVARFKSQGQVVSDEVSESQSWSKKIAAHVLYKNDQVEKLEIYSSLGSLVCARTPGEASAGCQCRN